MTGDYDKYYEYNDWLIMYGFTSRSRLFHLYGDVTIAGEGLLNLGLCSALRVLSREGCLSCHTYCDIGPWFFRSRPKDHPIQSPFTTHEGMWRIYYSLDPQRHIWNKFLSNPIVLIFWCGQFCSSTTFI
jgi:hypothetical protein